MKISDLFCNPATGSISHSKLWANIACAAATYKFISLEAATWEIWAVYLGCSGGYAAARRWIAAKVQIADINETEADTNEEEK